MLATGCWPDRENSLIELDVIMVPIKVFPLCLYF